MGVAFWVWVFVDKKNDLWLKIHRQEQRPPALLGLPERQEQHRLDPEDDSDSQRILVLGEPSPCKTSS